MEIFGLQRPGTHPPDDLFVKGVFATGGTHKMPDVSVLEECSGSTCGIFDKDECFDYDCQKQEDNHMSFAGISFFHGNIIAFADSKGSRLVDGQLCWDKERGNVRKIFSNNLFVCVTHGCNQVSYRKGDKYVRENLEDVIGRLLLDDMSPFEFFSFFYRFLNNRESIANTVFQFHVGYLKRSGTGRVPVHVSIEVSKERFSYAETLCREDGLWYAGDSNYVSYFDQSQHLLLARPEDIRSSIEQAVEMFDKELQYNSVGLPILAEGFVPERAV